jgi:hypothetical protein
MAVDAQYKSWALKIVPKFNSLVFKRSHVEKNLDVAKLHICIFARLFWLNCHNILQEAKWLHKGN